MNSLIPICIRVKEKNKYIIVERLKNGFKSSSNDILD